MGESERYQDYKHLRKKKSILAGSDRNALMALVIFNIVFFLILMTMQVVFFYYEQTPDAFQHNIVRWFSLPANLTTFSERPWTLLTYMFSDTGSNLMRLVSNLFWIWAFGYLLQEMSGNDKLIPVYLYGGIAGAVFFIGAHYLFPSLHIQTGNDYLLGANASSMAIATATTTLSPDHRFFTHIRKGIPIWVLLTLYILIDYAGVATQNAAFSLSHLGGAAVGFFYVLLLRKGNDPGAWMNKAYDSFMNLFKPDSNQQKDNTKKKIFYKTGDRKPFEKKNTINQNRVDEILDKINSKGFHFLTEEEKDILKKASEDNSLL